MATTVSLNSDRSIMVTTFFAGKENGRCYLFTTPNKSVEVTEKNLLFILDLLDKMGK